MALNDLLNDWLTTHGHGSLSSMTRIGGGSINESFCVTSSRGRSFFVKTHSSAPDNMFFSEAAGLKALEKTQTFCIPKVRCVEDTFLLLDHIPETKKSPSYWQEFGQSLASLHRQTSNEFGYEIDNYCGLTPQINTPTENGWEFFAQQRLLFQGQLAYDHQRINGGLMQSLEKLCNRLSSLIPSQPASLIHGDLWSGNALIGPLGQPALIDPAVYYGWAEAELAMTCLFGGFPDEFYSAYESCSSLPAHWRDRTDLYNLYPLLNHLNLFGGGYLARVEAVIHKYQ